MYTCLYIFINILRLYTYILVLNGAGRRDSDDAGVSDEVSYKCL